MKWRMFLLFFILACSVILLISPVFAQESGTQTVHTIGGLFRVVGENAIDKLIDTLVQDEPTALMNAEDLKRRGDKYKEKCYECKITFDQEFIKKFPSGRLPPTYRIDFLPNDDPLKRAFMDYTNNCDKALESYELALKETSENNYEGKAALFERSAEIYRTVGGEKNNEYAQQLENASAVAHARALARGIFEPLPPWIAVLAILAAVLCINHRKIFRK